jgi:hypothetical protein
MQWDAELDRLYRIMASARSEKRQLQRELGDAWNDLQATIARNDPEISRLKAERRDLKADAADESAAATRAFDAGERREGFDHVERAKGLRAEADDLWNDCGELIEENKAARETHSQAREAYLAAKERFLDAQVAYEDRREAVEAEPQMLGAELGADDRGAQSFIRRSGRKTYQDEAEYERSVVGDIDALHEAGYDGDDIGRHNKTFNAKEVARLASEESSSRAAQAGHIVRDEFEKDGDMGVPRNRHEKSAD